MGKSRGDAMDADPHGGMSMEKKEAIWILENGAWWDRKKRKRPERAASFLLGSLLFIRFLGFYLFISIPGISIALLSVSGFPSPKTGGLK